jgi:hypothetical protein
VKLLLALGTATGLLWAASAGVGYASLVATTGPATSVTSTTATVNGVAVTLSPSSAWAFEYGPTQAYGHTTPGAAVGIGLTAVTATLSGLTPNTTYHYRLVVLEGSSLLPVDWSTGADATFTTAPAVTYGTVSLPGPRLAVRGDKVMVPLLCTGGLCKGTVSLRAHGRHGASARCGTTRVSLSDGERRTVEPQIGASCVGLLRHARSVHMTLVETLAGAAKQLTTPVTLVRL